MRNETRESRWRNLMFPLLWDWGHEEGGTDDRACAHLARATNLFYPPEIGVPSRTGRRLKEQAAILDAYKPAQVAESLAVCSSYHAANVRCWENSRHT
jgi:hypothetical protein